MSRDGSQLSTKVTIVQGKNKSIIGLLLITKITAGGKNNVVRQCSTSMLKLSETPLELSWVPLRGPAIQANGRLTFEDDLRSGALLCFTTQ